MFEYDDLESYIDEIRKWLVHSTWHYSEEHANELINERMEWIKDAYAKGEDVGDIAVDVGYCCG